MKNHGTILTKDVYSDNEFPDAVQEAWKAAGRRFGYGAPIEKFFDIDVQFLTCSRWGDVYMVHVTDKSSGATASVRLTQQNVRHGGSFHPLATR